MNQDSENFEQLRRLLALKRHEVPPPGYFDGFSRDVMARIKAGERGERLSNAGWLNRLWVVLETKPIFAGAFGAAVCAVLVSGILNSGEGETASGPVLNPLGAQANNPFGAAPAGTVALNEGGGLNSVLSTNHAATLNSLFDFHLEARPVSYTPNGN